MLEPGDSVELAELSRDLHWSESDLFEAMSVLDEARQANNYFMDELFKKLFNKEDIEDNINNVLKNLDNIDSKVENQDRILLKSIKK